MEASGHLHASAGLPPGKETPVRTGCTKWYLEETEGKRPFEDLGIDARIILEWIDFGK